MKFAVMASTLSENIYVGKASEKQDSFVQKEEATDMVLFATAQYVSRNFDGGLEVTFPKGGIKMTVKVEPMVEDESGAE